VAADWATRRKTPNCIRTGREGERGIWDINREERGRVNNKLSSRGGRLQYLHRSPESRRRRRKGNPVAGGITGPPCSGGINTQTWFSRLGAGRKVNDLALSKNYCWETKEVKTAWNLEDFSKESYGSKRAVLSTMIMNLLNSLMELSSSSEAVSCVATQELPSILCNPKVHYRVHKSPPLVRILRQIYPVHIIPSYLSRIRFNTVHPPTSLSS
jgi:hypothetical protein